MQAPFVPFHMPNQVKYFMEPYKVITNFKSCPLQTSKSKLDSYKFGVFWKFIHGRNLNGAHDSLVDAVAQMDVITSTQFALYINCSASIHTIDNIFSNAQQNASFAYMDLQRALITRKRSKRLSWSIVADLGGGLTSAQLSK